MSRKWIAPAGLVIVGLLAFFIYRKYNVAPEIDLQQLELVDLEERPVQFSSFQGKKLLVCFGASWCGNCHDELNVLASIKDKDLSDVDVLVISDEPVEKVRKFKERRQYPFTFLKMNKSFAEMGIHSIPTSYIVNTKLEIKKETVGYLDWEDPSTLQHLKKLME
jgi:peroxiredoxin